MMTEPFSPLAKLCGILIIVLVLVTASGLLSPVLNSNDAYFYAVLSKNIVSGHNWIDLYYGGQDWLDKPHLPFWLTAISFKLFGVHAFAYVLPGFIFHLIGVYYTYRLARLLYNAEVGLIAALIYAGSLHLLLSAMDVRAEAYLLGEIMPACYYWLCYDRRYSWRNLLLASFFTGLALMTKGLFVVITIFSGLVASWLYTRQYRRMLQPQWLFAYLCCLLWALPEFVCLYLQFDAHPEKIIFGQTGVSGLEWFFWGSQFGRFFNSGPIVNTHGSPLFFVHTFLWAFLPWSIIFLVALYSGVRNFRAQPAVLRAKRVYLLSSFGLSFIMFSATKFQLDHYTNIIMPFAAILCGEYLFRQADLRHLMYFQRGLSILLLCLTAGLMLWLVKFSLASLWVVLPLALLGLIYRGRHLSYLEQSLCWPVAAISGVFIFLMLVNGLLYTRYDMGYNVAQFTRAAPREVVYLYQVNGVINNLTFHAPNPVRELTTQAQLAELKHGYLLISAQPSQALSELHLPLDAVQVGEFDGLAMEKFIPALFKPQFFQQNVQHARLIYLP